MLRHNPRPDDDGTIPVRARVAGRVEDGHVVGLPRRLVRRRRRVRTCSSSGSATSTGRGNPAFVGVDAAAPLFFRIVDALNLARPAETRAAAGAAAGRQPASRCAPAAATCRTPIARTRWTPGTSRASRRSASASCIARSRSIAQTGRPGCPPYAAGTRFEVFEFWSSDMLKLFRQAGMPRRTPPPLPACATDDPTGAAAHRVAAAQRHATRCAVRRRRK